MIKKIYRHLRVRMGRLSLPNVPNTWNEDEYLNANPDVKQAIESGTLSSGFEHWFLHGRKEKRKGDARSDSTPQSDSSQRSRPFGRFDEPVQLLGRRGANGELSVEAWDEESYLQQNPDVRDAVRNDILTSGLEHWKIFGRFEGRRLAPKLPLWLKREMLAQSEIEPKIFPSADLEARVIEHFQRPHGAGDALITLLRQVGNKSFTHVFLLPWLKQGGADVEALHHITVLATHFAARVLIILTEDTDSPWLDRLPPSVEFLHFGRTVGQIDPGSAQLILMRLLLKLKVPVIHNVNSAIGWEIYSRFGTALRSCSKLYASVFCFDYSAEGEPVGYARSLERAYANLEGIFCDNKAFIKTLSDLYGFYGQSFRPLRYPVPITPRFNYIPEVSPSKPKMLWAGRLDRQKRPDILKKIAESLPDCLFHVYGARLLDASIENTQIIDQLCELKNVEFIGPFNGFDSIPSDNYLTLLYTTQWDGMPNVVLEGLASGLTVIAPDVGGISEVISADSGFLVEKFDDVVSYVETIRKLIAHPDLVAQERHRQLQAMQNHYSADQFVAALSDVRAYSSPEVGVYNEASKARA